MKLLLLVLLYFSSLGAISIDISSHNIANGKTIFIEFVKDKGIKYNSVFFGKKEYKILNNPSDKTKMYTIVPISYYAKASQKQLKITYKDYDIDKNESISINIKDGNYEKESIVVNKSKVNPRKKKVKIRISKEYNEAMKIYNTSTDVNYIKSKFIMPIDSKITSSFGKARVYNGSLNGYHSGTDFRAKIGTPIVASNDGKVALVKDRFYSGGTVLIDHGQGIYTCYFHMSKFEVKKNQHVKRGQIIGLSGVSGRVTGPHLHFSARVGGVQVDPLQLVTLLNKKLFTKSTSALGILPKETKR